MSEQEEWLVQEETYLLLKPLPPKYQSSLSERQIEGLVEIYKDNPIKMGFNELSHPNLLQIGGKSCELIAETGS